MSVEELKAKLDRVKAVYGNDAVIAAVKDGEIYLRDIDGSTFRAVIR